MAEEIQEAVQIIRVAYDGIEIFIKIGSGGLHVVQKIIDVLKQLLDYEKSIGKTGMRNLLKRGGDLQIFQFRAENLRKVKKMAKKYGILYTVLPNINADKGLVEIAFHNEALPRVNMMLEKFQGSRVSSMDDFLQEGNGEQMSKLSQFLEEERQKGNSLVHTDDKQTDHEIESLLEKVGMYAMKKESVSVDNVKEDFSVSKEQAEDVLSKLETIGVLAHEDTDGNRKVLMEQEAFENRIRGYRALAERMAAISKTKDTNLSEITISKNLISEESPTAVKTRVPGTYGKNVRYLWVGKDQIIDIHGGKTMLTFLNMEKEYKLYDDQNRVIETKKGSELYSSHYDAVDIQVQQRYEKMLNDKKKRELESERKLFEASTKQAENVSGRKR